ncbi:Uncharacterised protein [uncultured archaeon]|nr:Uncharacterised protein [uncultured archaeon]
MISEEELINRIAPKIEERIQYKIIKSIIHTLEEEFYPPEEMIRKEFIKAVKEAEKGNGIAFKDTDELHAYLESLAS